MLATLMVALNGMHKQAAPLRSPGTGSDPEIRRITMTADLPSYDPTGGEGITKTVYFSNSVAGVITMTFDISGTPTLTLTAGAAFDEPERTYTSTSQEWTVAVTYSVSTTHTTQTNIAYTATNTNGVQTTVVITYMQDITAPTATIVSPPAGYFTGTLLVIAGTAQDNDGGSGVQWVQVTTGTAWVTATGTTDWSYTATMPSADGVVYTVSARAGDYLGILQSPAATRVITVDNVAPANPDVVTTTNGTPTGTWINYSTIPVSWTAVSDGSGVSYYYTWTQQSGTTVDEAAPFTTTTAVTGTNLPEGDNWFYLRARDGAGNWATDTVHLGPFKVDLTSPTVGILTPTSGMRLTTTHLTNYVITGTASDTRSGIARVEVTTGTSWVRAEGTTAWAYTWTLPITDNVVYTLTARVHDNAGNVGSSSNVKVTVDTVAPTAAAPVPDRSPWVTSTLVYAWVASTDNAGIAGYRVNITNTAGYSAVFSTAEPVFTFTQALTEGAGYYARVQAWDANGNVGGWSGPGTVVTPDLTAPTISNPSIQESSQYFYVSGLTLFYTNTMSAADSFTVKGNAADSLSGLDKATFSPAFGQTPSDDTDPAVFTGNYDVSPGSTESGVITATVYDKAGNTAVQTYTYALDGTPPESTALAPTYAKSSPIAVTWVATDTQSGVYSTTLWYKKGTGTWTAAQTINAVSGTFSFNPPEGDGLYLFATVAADNLGNLEAGPTVSETQTVYDTHPPTVVITAPKHISSTTFIVEWRAEDTTSGVAFYDVQYRVGQGEWQDWVTNTTEVSRTFAASQTDVDYTFRVTAYDRAGNSGQATTTTRVGPFRIYLPLALRGWVWWYQYDPYEPNDTPAQAWGPLQSGQTYEAYIWDTTDRDDYYHFTPSTNSTVQIILSNIPADCDYDLYVYYYDGQKYEPVAWSNWSGSGDENVTFTPVQGRKYYVRIYPAKGFSSQQPYRLRATFQ